MKKFISLVLALIIALSASAVAFAAGTFECGVCHAVFADEKAYTAHMNSGCLEQYKDCQYCGAKVANENIEAHEADCPKGSGSCEYCGEDYATQADYAKHKESECKLINAVGEDVAKIIIKVIDFFKGIDWNDIFGKIGDFIGGIDFGGIVDQIKPVFEKIVNFIKDAAGNIELPAAA